MILEFNLVLFLVQEYDDQYTSLSHIYYNSAYLSVRLFVYPGTFLNLRRMFHSVFCLFVCLETFLILKRIISNFWNYLEVLGLFIDFFLKNC